MDFRSISMHAHASGKTLEWFGADNEEKYQSNIHRLAEHGWLDVKFTYKFNDFGFRSDDFLEDEDSIMFFGGSDTIGTGLPLENTWAHIVSQHLGLRCYNLGINGGSCDGAFRMGSYWIPKLKPKIVVFMSPPNTRLEIVDDYLGSEKRLINGIHKKFYEINHEAVAIAELGKFYNVWLSADENIELNTEKNVLAMAKMCDNLGIKYVMADTYQDWSNIDKSRDLIHAGIKTNAAVAQRIINRIA